MQRDLSFSILACRDKGTNPQAGTAQATRNRTGQLNHFIAPMVTETAECDNNTV